jgi:hypothetical protein
MTEANQCIGEEAAYTGATTTYTTVDPNQPQGDLTPQLPFGPVNVPVIELPPPRKKSPAD